MRRAILLCFLSASGFSPFLGQTGPSVARAERPVPAPGEVQVEPGDAADDGEDLAASQAPASPVYHGVAPGSDQLPPRAPKLPVRGPVRMTFPGFQVRGGVATVFFQLTGPVAWSVSEGDGKIVYTLTSTTVPVANNRRPLDVSHFKTAVKSVEARQHGRDVEVTIRLDPKTKRASHRERTESNAAGYKFLVIEVNPALRLHAPGGPCAMVIGPRSRRGTLMYNEEKDAPIAAWLCPIARSYRLYPQQR